MFTFVKYQSGYQAYVAGDGNYGVESVVTFDYDEFCEAYPTVFNKLDEMNDSTRCEFIQAILEENEEWLQEICDDYGWTIQEALGK